MKIALGIEYDGAHFHGWQKQSTKLRTVQQTLELALSKLANHPIQTICAGRTDAGVHAQGQVVHFETDAERSQDSWILGSNTWLPTDLRVTWAQPVSPEFNARFNATARRYNYVIYNTKTHPALFRNYVTWESFPLDADKMQQAAKYLLGEHDFSAFRARDCQSRSTQRNVQELTVTRQNELIIISIKANAFLHHMVRNIAGVLMAIGAGKKSVEWAQEVLASKNRQAAGVTAKPNGLSLMEVEYPEEFGIPKLQQHCKIFSSTSFWK